MKTNYSLLRCGQQRGKHTVVGGEHDGLPLMHRRSADDSTIRYILTILWRQLPSVACVACVLAISVGMCSSAVPFIENNVGSIRTGHSAVDIGL